MNSISTPRVTVTGLILMLSALSTMTLGGGGHPIPEMDVAGPADGFDMSSRLMTSSRRMTVRLSIPGEGTVRVPTFNGTFFYSPENPEATTGTLLFRTDEFLNVKGKMARQLTEILDFEAHPFFAFQSHSASRSADGVDLMGKLIVKDRETDAVLQFVSPGSVAESMDGERWIKFKGTMNVDTAEIGLESLGTSLEFDLDLFLINYTAVKAKATGINPRGLDKHPPSLPRSADDLSNAGWYLMLNQRYEEAIQAFDLSLDKEPDVINNYLRRADAYVFNHEYGKAVGTYRTIANFMPVHPHILELNKVLDGEYLTPSTLDVANQKWTELQKQ